MEELLAKHRKEKKDLQAKITQKKKSASKKTRKGVNEECDRLEEELHTQQAEELAALSGETKNPEENGEVGDGHEDEPPQTELTADLTPSVDNLSIEEPTSQPKKPNRAKARLAKRAADQARMVEEAAVEADNLPDLRAQEKERLHAIIQKRGLQEKEVRADGHCLYAAVADQIQQRGESVKVGTVFDSPDAFRVVRYVAADYISNHPDDFIPFLEEDLNPYLKKIRDTGTWGGQIELMALSKAYNAKICVVHGDGNVIEIGDTEDDKRLWLAYYRHGFGLGEHYNSLRMSDSKP